MNKNQKIVLRAFIAFYLISFTIMNWNDISWIFNYRVTSSLLYSFFNPYQEITAKTQISNNYSDTYRNTATTKQKTEYPYSAKENTLEVPSIGVTVPIVLSQSTSIASLTKDLDKGVVLYPGSVLPGQPGQIIVLGHSAPPNWPRIKHDWVFSELNNLSSGDSVKIVLDHKEYTYTFLEKKILAKGEDIQPTTLSTGKNVLVLVSCWPPGKNLQRIAVYTELVSN